MKRTFTIHDLPINERPRERIQLHGEQSLSAQELLAVILGRGISGESVMVTGQRLLSQFGSLEGIANASLQDLITVKGLGPAKACQIKACFEIARRIRVVPGNEAKKRGKHSVSSEEIASLVRGKITNFKKEHFILLSFDTRNNLISTDIVSVGTLNASLVHPREVFDIAIRRHSVWIVVAHNHPSGDPDPSSEDIKVTERITEAGRLMGIEVLDHVIITENGYYSFREQGLFT